MNRPLFSIIVPVYRVEKYIQDCLNSILTQSFKNFEILIVNDKTNDDSINSIKNIIKNDDRIKLINHRKNKGLGAARNTGLRHAKGKYILCVDSDDWLSNDCLEILYQTTMNLPTLNVIWFKYTEINEETGNYINCTYTHFKKLPQGFININKNNIQDFAVMSWNKLYKTNFLKKNKLRWPEGCYFEDVEFFYKVHTKNPKIFLIDKNLYIYRIRQNSIMNNSAKNYKMAADRFKITYNLYRYLKKNNLFEKYKKPFFEHLGSVINTYRNNSFSKEEKKELKLEINQMLEKIKIFKGK